MNERFILPLYEFKCRKCFKVYEELTSCDSTGKYKTVKCPDCGSKSKEKLLSVCGFMFSNPEGTDRWNSETSGHDYRFHHNLPRVIEERRNAEEKSHMGTDVYNPINDLDNDNAWGEVK
jgi:putative FmdB family regulatory protein